MSTNPQTGSTANSTADSTAAATSTADVQTFVRDGQEFTEVKEGLARILVPFKKTNPSDKANKSVQEQQQVFYNPIQQFNRDLTVLAIKAYGEEFISKQRSANGAQVAKRKRDKSDTHGPGLKKKPQEPGVAAELKSADVANFAQADNQSAEAVDTKMTDVQESTQLHGQDKADLGAAIDQPPVEVVKTTSPNFTILDALSATGLRALRYAQELPFVTSVTANDLTQSAVDAIHRNAVHNGVESKIVATQGDARVHMYSMLNEESPGHKKEKHPKKNNAKTKKYNVIDLDPYGTAVPFLDGAVNAVRDDGGLLCVTCTDSGVWASNGYPEKAFSLYGGIPIKGTYSHEVGLRLILHAIATTASKYGLAMEPLLSLSIDYYARVFVRIRRSPSQVKFLAGKTMIVYSCDHGCGAWVTQLLARNKIAKNSSGTGTYYKHGTSLAPTADRLCEHCDSKMHLAGPMYAGPLHAPEFIQRILDDLPNASDDIYGTKTRIEGMLYTALEELLLSPVAPKRTKEDEFAALEPYPFYFHPTNLAGALHCVCPDEDSLRGALRHLGYEVTRSHCKGGSMKTNAPWSVVWHVMREWTRQKHPVTPKNIAENSPSYKLHRLGDTEKKDGNVDDLEVVFDQRLGRDRSKQGLVRYQTNPRENWGPQSRAKQH